MFTSSVAQAVRRTVTSVVFTIAGLSFAFGFGNGWQIGLALGVPGWIAPLVAPAVDLSVVALLASVQFLRAHGVSDRLIGPRVLLVTCGAITFGLNTARPILAGAYGRACFDAVAPLLLIGWSEVGPNLLTLLHRTVQDDSGTVPDRPVLTPDLMVQAQVAAQQHRDKHGRRITRDALRAQLNVSNAVAGQLLRELRAASNGSELCVQIIHSFHRKSAAVNSTP
jgi:hypothetical protein